MFQLLKIWDYIPIYRDVNSLRIDLNWIRTNEDKFENNYEWLEVFNKQYGLFMKMVKISYYCVNVFDSLFFFVFATILFKRNDKKK